MALAPAEHRIATPDGAICWFEWGQRSDNEPSVLLLHATGFHARVWDRVIACLPSDTHVIAADHRGHGRSYRPPSLSNWAANAEALLPLVDAFAGTPLVGCGHSMGGFALTRLAALRPAAFRHLVLIDPTIVDPTLYVGADSPPPDPADHPVARRRNLWDGPDAMITRFADRLPYSAWQPGVLIDYCRFGLLPTASGEGWELACPPTLEASVYLGAYRCNPFDWLFGVAAPVSIIRARTGDRAGPLDFSSSPTWPQLGTHMKAVLDEQWTEHSHFIPMETPSRVALLIANAL